MSRGLLTGEVALVVGAASGIGRAVAERFLDEGAHLVALDLDGELLAPLAAARPERVEALAGDATEAAPCAAAVERALARFGRLDVLVHCAGRFDFRALVEPLAAANLAAAFDEIFSVNVKSALLAVHAAAKALRTSRGSAIFTLSSSAVHPEGAGVLYGASKWALRGLVVHLARELAPEVRVNGVAPGGTASTRLAGLRSLDQRHTVADVADRDARLAVGNLLGALPVPADHAGAYVFLASRELSPLLTGTVLCSDGGRGEPLHAPREAASAAPPRRPVDPARR